MLKRISLLRERVESWDTYPFSVPTLRNFEELRLHERVCFFTGENGSGKSTLLEAIAAHYGFGREGGTRNFRNNSTESNYSIDPLVRALRLAFDKRTGAGFFLRAESFFNVASHIDELDQDASAGPLIRHSYGGKSLHNQSHGESFFTLLEERFQDNGLFLLDEPEAALSPQRQLAFLVLLHDVLKAYKDAQFIISTHSPVLLSFPGAQIVSFDDGHLHEIAYEDSAPFHIVRRVVNDRANFLRELFAIEQPTLFDEPTKG